MYSNGHFIRRRVGGGGPGDKRLVGPRNSAATEKLLPDWRLLVRGYRASQGFGDEEAGLLLVEDWARSW